MAERGARIETVAPLCRVRGDSACGLKLGRRAESGLVGAAMPRRFLAVAVAMMVPAVAGAVAPHLEGVTVNQFGRLAVAVSFKE